MDLHVHAMSLCSSTKYLYPHQGRLTESPNRSGGGGGGGEGGGQNPQFVKESMKLKQNFQGGGGWVVQSQDPSIGGVWIVSGTPHCCK